MGVSRSPHHMFHMSSVQSWISENFDHKHSTHSSLSVNQKQVDLSLSKFSMNSIWGCSLHN